MSSQVDIRTYLVSKIKVDNVSGCWVWMGSKRGKGYGYFAMKGKNQAAHRVSYSFFNNQVIPSGMLVCHHCDNPPCINPSHLFLGTGQDNADDMKRKGRSRIVQGENSPTSKLKTSQVLEIKLALSKGVNSQELADKFNVHYSTISLIRNGKRWAHLH